MRKLHGRAGLHGQRDVVGKLPRRATACWCGEVTAGRFPPRYAADLTPRCERCGRIAEAGAIFTSSKTLAPVCLECLTDEEREQLVVGAWPWTEEQE
jgi:hypothetical protein